MGFLDLFRRGYAAADNAVIISCYFNPMKSPYRLKAFKRWYDSIRHLDHRIVECVIGDDEPQLPENALIKRVHTENLLWHKEALLNGLIADLPERFKYVFWIDADLIFTNRNWLPESVQRLQAARIIQPFDTCVHLEQDEVRPSFDLSQVKNFSGPQRPKTVWRSFAYNWVANRRFAESTDYDTHGHVGFAWGAVRSLLEEFPLYDRALIGGADHIIAHAAVGQVPCECITKAFAADLAPVEDWSRRFYTSARGKLSYTPGAVYHLWHGDIDKRQYLKRIQDFTAAAVMIKEKDANGLYVTKKRDDPYMTRYFQEREATNAARRRSFWTVSNDDPFMSSMALGYLTDSPIYGGIVGGDFAGAWVGHQLHQSTSNVSQPANVPPADVSGALQSSVNAAETAAAEAAVAATADMLDAPSNDAANASSGNFS